MLYLFKIHAISNIATKQWYIAAAVRAIEITATVTVSVTYNYINNNGNCNV